jgi:hypothetical protein
MLRRIRLKHVMCSIEDNPTGATGQRAIAASIAANEDIALVNI